MRLSMDKYCAGEADIDYYAQAEAGVSEPEEEYAECQTKIGKIINAFNES